MSKRPSRRKLGSDFNAGGLSSDNSLLASVEVASFAFTMFGVFALVMGGFIILNTFRTLVAERRHDIGMLRAIGADRSTILGIFMVQSVLQGALGTAAGLALGYLITLAGLAAYQPLLRDIVRIDASLAPSYSVTTWVSAIALGMGVTVLGAVIPARQAARVTPLEALRPQVAEVTERQRSRWVTVGWVVLGSVGADASRPRVAVGGPRRDVRHRRSGDGGAGSHRAALARAVLRRPTVLARDGRPGDVQRHAAAGTRRGDGERDPRLAGGRGRDARAHHLDLRRLLRLPRQVAGLGLRVHPARPHPRRRARGCR